MALFLRDTDIYTSPNGLRFPTTYSAAYLDCQGNWDCDLNQQIDTRSATSLQACEDLCSTARPRCYGVSFNTVANTCSLKGYPMTNLTSSTSYVSAAADTTQIIGTVPSCTNTTVGDCTAVCDVQYGAAGGYQPTNIAKGFHADTFEDCSNYCSEAQPLCKSFTWNPAMDYGYANCYLKNVSLSTLSGQPWSGLRSCDVLSTTYETITPDTISGYNLSTGKASGAYASLHAESLEDCTSACNTSCVAVNLDLTFANGYQNCYLLNSTATVTTTSGWTYASKLVTSTPSASSTAPAATSTPSSGGSQAWIAGPVIGGILAVVIIAALILWLRRRKRAAPPAYVPPPYAQNEKNPVVYSYYTNDAPMAPSELPVPPAMLSSDVTRHELPAQSPAMELPGSPRQK